MKKIINFLSSAKLAIVLFFVLAAFSTLGTLLPQGAPPQVYLMKYGETFGKLILYFGLNDTYHSWWYIFSLFLFLTNLILCSIKRFPVSWKLYKKDPVKINLANLPFKQTLRIKENFEKLENKLLSLGFKKVIKGEEKIFIKDKCRWSYLSVYFVHFSLVLVILGGIIGGIWGYRGNMFLFEGGSSNQVMPFRGDKPIFLPFTVKLNKFKLELYPDGTPKEYISYITIIDEKNKVNATVRVNHPFTYKGITFYQASYDVIPEFVIEVKTKGIKGTYTLAPNNPLFIENRYTIVLEGYRAHRGFVACKIAVFDAETGSSKETFLIQGRTTRFHLGNIPFSISMKEIKEKYASGLQVKKDPGVPLVYLGFLTIIIGLIAVYFCEPKTFWAYLKEKEKLLILGATSKRDRAELKLELQRLAEELGRV